jgi:hypothetical protein
VARGLLRWWGLLLLLGVGWGGHAALEGALVGLSAAGGVGRLQGDLAVAGGVGRRGLWGGYDRGVRGRREALPLELYSGGEVRQVLQHGGDGPEADGEPVVVRRPVRPQRGQAAHHVTVLDAQLWHSTNGEAPGLVHGDPRGEGTANMCLYMILDSTVFSS